MVDFDKIMQDLTSPNTSENNLSILSNDILSDKRKFYEQLENDCKTLLKQHASMETRRHKHHMLTSSVSEENQFLTNFNDDQLMIINERCHLVSCSITRILKNRPMVKNHQQQ